MVKTVSPNSVRGLMVHLVRREKYDLVAELLDVVFCGDAEIRIDWALAGGREMREYAANWVAEIASCMYNATTSDDVATRARILRVSHACMDAGVAGKGNLRELVLMYHEFKLAECLALIDESEELFV